MKTKEEQLAFKKDAQIIFQDPYASLDPRMTVGEIIAEGMDNHHLYEGEKRLPRIYELLEQVGLNRSMRIGSHMNFQEDRDSVSELPARWP